MCLKPSRHCSQEPPAPGLRCLKLRVHRALGCRAGCFLLERDPVQTHPGCPAGLACLEMVVSPIQVFPKLDHSLASRNLLPRSSWPGFHFPVFDLVSAGSSQVAIPGCYLTLCFSLWVPLSCPPDSLCGPPILSLGLLSPWHPPPSLYLPSKSASLS